ncbi:hypothetical protein ABZS71_28070 [Streptomyces sp. NPDC005393]|uniref:hypothetical protein n=1 Tax=Streptomyces sp. NPDC005393 TaxID=3157041 RepID=UPI0033AD3562
MAGHHARPRATPADRSSLRLTADEADWLRHGLELAARDIEARIPGKQIVVTVHLVLFPEADFQAEGLAAALLAWAEEEFGLFARPVSVSFDGERNRFAFTW